MKRPKTDEDDDGGLDSLLDTMTNVVGILVLVLIVTQMSVTEVVSRVIEETKVDAEKLEEVKQQLAVKEDEKKELERILVAPNEIDAEKQLEELQKKKELLARLKQEREEKKRKKNEFAMKIKNEQEEAAKAKEKVAETEEKRKEVSTLISTSLAKKAQLEAMLDKTPVRSAPADIKVTIPNPRPAPPGAKRAVFVCDGDRVFPVNEEYFRARAVERAKEIVKRFRLDTDKEKGIDPAKFTPHFEKLSDEDAFLNVKYYVDRNRYPRLQFIPKLKVGATKTQLISSRSVIRRQYLNNLDITKYYARFVVLPDSYDIYLTARRVMQDANMLAGWDPQPQDYKYTTWVGTVELGPPLPPPDPNRPKPKPANAID